MKPITKRPKKTKKGPTEQNVLVMSNSLVVKADGLQPLMERGDPQVKFVDVQYNVSVSNIGTILSGICNIPQGITVNQRTGDTVFWKSLYINYSVNTQNVDVFNLLRVIVFQWRPNTLLNVPVVTDILQITSVYSMYDWQFSNQFTVLYDKVHFMSGTAAAPDAAGNQGYFGQIKLKGPARADFAQGIAGGSNQYFILVISDSVAIPFPVFVAVTRITYSEE